MDKETAVEIERLRAAIEAGSVDRKALWKDLGEQKEWISMSRKIIYRILVWIIIAGSSGAFMGWKLPQGQRQSIVEWLLNWATK